MVRPWSVPLISKRLYVNRNATVIFSTSTVRTCMMIHVHVYTYYQELMKEGASNCVERHLTIATLPFYGHILKWGISVVFIANALRRAPYRTQACAYVRVYAAQARGDSKLRFTIAAMEQEREGQIERLRKRQATTPHRTAKRSRLLEAKLRSKTVSRPPKMTAQFGYFQLLTPRGNPKRVYSTGGSGQTIHWSALGSSH